MPIAVCSVWVGCELCVRGCRGGMKGVDVVVVDVGLSGGVIGLTGGGF